MFQDEFQPPHALLQGTEFDVRAAKAQLRFQARPGQGVELHHVLQHACFQQSLSRFVVLPAHRLQQDGIGSIVLVDDLPDRSELGRVRGFDGGHELMAGRCQEFLQQPDGFSGIAGRRRVGLLEDLPGPVGFIDVDRVVLARSDRGHAQAQQSKQVGDGTVHGVPFMVSVPQRILRSNPTGIAC